MNFYKSFILIWLCMPLVAIAHPNDKYKKTKKINKTYSVKEGANVAIENSFGNVTIQIWDQNTVSIAVIVEVSGNDQDRVNNRLEMIDVNFNASKFKIRAESKIPNENSGIMSWLNGNSKTNTRVDFIVRMPKSSPLDVANNYGAIIIKKMKAPLKLSCDFGRLQIGQLLHTNNELSFDYTDNSNIDYMKAGVIKADFSKFKLYGAGTLDFSSDYTTATFGPVQNLKYNSDFSTLTIEKATEIDGRGDYSTITIETVIKDAILKADFGTISIENLDKDFENLNIKSDYTTVKVGYDRNATFNYECKTEFGSLKLDANLITVNSRKEMNETFKEGYCNSQDGKSTIQINSSFGSVTLKSNN